jgi:hypothetical protein
MWWGFYPLTLILGTTLYSSALVFRRDLSHPGTSFGTTRSAPGRE